MQSKHTLAEAAVSRMRCSDYFRRGVEAGAAETAEKEPKLGSAKKILVTKVKKREKNLI